MCSLAIVLDKKAEMKIGWTWNAAVAHLVKKVKNRPLMNISIMAILRIDNTRNPLKIFFPFYSREFLSASLNKFNKYQYTKCKDDF